MEIGENRTVIGMIAIMLLLFAVAIFFYNRTLNELAAGICGDVPGSCPHEKVVETQNIIIGALILVIMGIVAWLFTQLRRKPHHAAHEAQGSPALPASPLPPQQRKVNLSELDSDEKKVVALLQEKQGSVFQSEVIKLTGFSKVKVSRILDKMEHNGLIERKRRGMANLVVLR